jgi:hypothetical protein
MNVASTAGSTPQRIAGGAIRTADIEHALDDAEFVLALMISGLRFRNLPCRATARLRKDRCVIPLKAGQLGPMAWT